MGEAVEQFHMALSLRPSVEAAAEITSELERVETMMREESGLHANDENNGQAFDEYEGQADEDDVDGEMEEDEFAGEDEEVMDEDEGYAHEEDKEVDGILEDSPDHDTYNQLQSMEQPTTRRSSHGQRTNISTSSSSSNRAIDLNRFAGFHDDAEYDDEDEDGRAVGVLYDSDDPDQDMAIAHAAAAAFSSEGEEEVEEVIGRRRGRASGQRSSSSASSNRSGHITPSDSRLYSLEATNSTQHRSNGRRISTSSSSVPTLGSVPDSVRRTTRSMTSRTPPT